MTYQVTAKYEKKGQDIEFNTDKYELAENMFWMLVNKCKDQLDNYEIKWMKFLEDTEHQLLILNKTFD